MGFSLQPGDLSLCDLRQPMELEHLGRQDTIVFGAPAAVFERYLPTDDLPLGLVIGPEQSGLLTGHLQAMADMAPTLLNPAAPALARATFELIAVTVRLAREERRSAGQGGAGTALAQAKAWIDDNLQDPELTPAKAAREQGLSRTALYGLFENTGGVAQYIWSRRLSAVENVLANPAERRSMLALALEWGLTSEAHFSPCSAAPTASRLATFAATSASPGHRR